MAPSLAVNNIVDKCGCFLFLDYTGYFLDKVFRILTEELKFYWKNGMQYLNNSSSSEICILGNFSDKIISDIPEYIGSQTGLSLKLCQARVRPQALFIDLVILRSCSNSHYDPTHLKFCIDICDTILNQLCTIKINLIGRDSIYFGPKMLELFF